METIWKNKDMIPIKKMENKKNGGITGKKIS